MPYPKIVFFDLEGTLLKKEIDLDFGKVAPSAWVAVARRLGPDCLREEVITQEKWNKKEYAGYVEWMKATIEIHQRYGLTKQLFDEVLSRASFNKAVPEAVQEIRTRCRWTGIISGGFKQLADYAQVALKIDHALAGCEYFFASDGSVAHFNLLPSDEAGKVAFMQHICQEHGVDPLLECAFVGDGKNDVAIAKAVGISIAYCAQEELKRVASVCIDDADFRKVSSALLELAQ